MAGKHKTSEASSNAPHGDDLKAIDGIGPGLERLLHEAGIHGYAQLGALSETELAELVNEIPGLSADRIAREDWVGQARRLAVSAEGAAPSSVASDAVALVERGDGRDATASTARIGAGSEAGNRGGMDDAQPYATFKTQFLINDDGTVRATRVQHVQSEAQGQWADFAAAELLTFMSKRLVQSAGHSAATASRSNPKEVHMPAAIEATATVNVVAGDDTPLSNPIGYAIELNGAAEAPAVAEAPADDAYFAGITAPAGAYQVRPKSSLELTEIVQGPDDRLRVTATTDFPWRCVCALRIKAADGSQWIGTGWLVGPRTIITAGHCVYIHERGGWVQSIEVVPGRNGATRPFGTRTATRFHTVRGWVEGRRTSHDYGAITLGAGNGFDASIGHFGVAVASDADLATLTVNLAGYPGDKDAGTTQWFHSRQIASTSERRLYYDIDTMGGQSGAPVWRLDGDARHVVGIHTNGGTGFNSGVRIVSSVYNNILTWRAM